MKIRLLRSAREDLLKAYEFYEYQSEGIGKYFLDRVSADIDSLLLYAGIHPRPWSDYHWMLTHRFPYTISDCRRAPDTHLHRLDNEQK